MKNNYLYLLTILFLCATACTEEFVPTQEVIIGKWGGGNRVLEILDERVGQFILVDTAAGKRDTMLLEYTFVPDTFPMQFDFHIQTGVLKGMRRFGVVDFPHRDTFELTSNIGFEGQGNKFRPRKTIPEKAAVYIRQE